MAFRQSTFHTPQRVYTAPEETQVQPQKAQPTQGNSESQEWVLFSPSAESTADHTYTTSTGRTRTVGRSQISDFGSLDTAARSYRYDVGEGSEDTEGAIEEEEEDGELDSLDSHLHEFGAEPSVYRSSGVIDTGENSGTVLPTHDGLGSFRVDQTLMGEDIQEQLYAFERYNPRRVKRRRESLELGQLELGNERAAEAERTRRIQQWRMEQSRLLVDEIQRETRRRKMSMTSEKRVVVVDQEQEDLATLSTVGSSTYEEGVVTSEENQSFWNRITKRVIQDLMGIDDDLLSILFGESLPGDDFSTANRPLNTILTTNQFDHASWEYRLLERIGRELGLLVHQLSDHPSAFSTYLQTQQTPLPYAGLPIIPESTRDQPTQLETSTIDIPDFHPTIQKSQTVPIPISSTSLAPQRLDEVDAAPHPANPSLSREEWERDLDIKMVFRYLRSRFTSKFQSAPSNTPTTAFAASGTSHLATASTSESAARAARVRQHHPLVTHTSSSQRKSIERRTYKASVPGNPAGVQGTSMYTRRRSNSYASERLSVSARRNSGTGSSKYYWDFGGSSVKSGSLVVSTGGMGSWGEV